MDAHNLYNQIFAQNFKENKRSSDRTFLDKKNRTTLIEQIFTDKKLGVSLLLAVYGA